ncbi:autotransporter outer membrane beta-barrel domain-containing protein [Devosia sp. YR412]|uniref:autotransporter outer membrane beta-barrel domain-containing protein n=1 Tax=Devosia sp. YR412 TaxID=1881030 RepID=UPI0011145F34|nr:autotransporter outer membrane beta-barrel domain-containing protein [Devosia sp. YR412]
MLLGVVGFLLCGPVGMAQGLPDLSDALARNQQILANLPTAADRSDRLRGVIEVPKTPERFMKALPGIMSGTPIPVAASLAAYDKLGGNQKPRLYDLWLKGRSTLLAELGGGERRDVVSTGGDYLVNDSLLLGGFAQTDTRAASQLAGWSLGGFGTARLSENFYLDLLGARGGAGSWSEDERETANWLMTTAFSGKWQFDEWSFRPQARVSYFAAHAPALQDLDGALVEAQRRATGELALGPSVTYRLATVDNVVFTTGLKLDTVTKLSLDDALAVDGLRSGLEGTLNVELPSGTRWKSSFGYQGIGGENRRFDAKGTLTVPLR